MTNINKVCLTPRGFLALFSGIVVAQIRMKSGDSAEKKDKRKGAGGGEGRTGKSLDSGRASLIEFYGNAAYISTFSFAAAAAAKEIREAAEKLF